MENSTCLINHSTDNLYDSTNNFLRSFFICCGVLITGSTFALIVTARLLFQEVRKEYNSLYGYDSENEEHFNSKFLKEYLEMDSDTEDDNKNYDLKDKIVSEQCPRGLVILGYDLDNKCFYYYSDYKNVDYLYLEVIARKFVVTNNCKNLLINSKKEFIRVASKQLEKQDEVNIGSENSVFANFKPTEKNNNKVSIDYNLKIKDKEIPAPDNSNKYTYRGKISDYIPITEILDKRQKVGDDFENIDYEKFKKLS
jgi:hypothetical protein